MRNKLCLVTLVLVLVLVGMGGKEAVGQDVKTFYKGAKMRFIVPNPPGGTYDLWARMLVPPLEKYTGAKMLVENISDTSGGSIGPNYLYNRAKPDGLTICILPMTSLVISDTLEVEGVQYDLDKFAYIGRVDKADRGFCASKASGFKTMMDLQKATKTIRFITADVYAQNTVELTLEAEAFGLNATLIPGYKGSLGAVLALVAGREGEASNYSLSFIADQLKRDEFTLIATLGDKRSPLYPQTPTLLESEGLKPEGRKYVDLIALLGGAGRAISAPPGLPEDKRLFLQQALAASLKDPAITNLAEKQGLGIDYLPGKELKQLIDKLRQIVPKSERANLKHIVTKKYF